ncbi:MAG: hypothetical protein IMF11_14570 [Proteobacteria bacterium]|nr:hypothetical protein [Pseudomonadota bacterium]
MFLCYCFRYVKLEIGFDLDTQEDLHISIIVTGYGFKGSGFTENVNRPTSKANEKEITLPEAGKPESRF